MRWLLWKEFYKQFLSYIRLQAEKWLKNLTLEIQGRLAEIRVGFSGDGNKFQRKL